ncbi:hypothetical protein QR680_001092 [Steinernema hermaphroditum]|uniref:Uncharacterized protein n=1 Tax=Steinernema hermaphroditum TaxID=289476 RepID=A0AA39LFF2_9BILA|nr:hypothetical protein QR680_001092 [Steinernema hermaphroditum]
MLKGMKYIHIQWNGPTVQLSKTSKKSCSKPRFENLVNVIATKALIKRVYLECRIPSLEEEHQRRERILRGGSPLS